MEDTLGKLDFEALSVLSTFTALRPHPSSQLYGLSVHRVFFSDRNCLGPSSSTEGPERLLAQGPTPGMAGIHGSLSKIRCSASSRLTPCLAAVER